MIYLIGKGVESGLAFTIMESVRRERVFVRNGSRL